MTLAAALLPTTCPACGRAGAAPCPECWRELRPAPPLPPPAGLDACRSLLLYEGVARELIARLKYRNARSVVAWLVAGMVALVEPHVVAARAAATPFVVTWAPTTPDRRRARGFDQAEVLGRGVARGLGVPVRGVLVRRRGPPQTGRPAAERVHGVEFDARGRGPRGQLPGRPVVLVVDDVVTTGATLAAAGRALRTAGASSVVAVTAGRTPLKITNGDADA
ncbi:MAG TPA: phosphoribosyltransferase family protein [Acidimicrobiales bacterium]